MARYVHRCTMHGAHTHVSVYTGAHHACALSCYAHTLCICDIQSGHSMSTSIALCVLPCAHTCNAACTHIHAGTCAVMRTHMHNSMYAYPCVLSCTHTCNTTCITQLIQVSCVTLHALTIHLKASVTRVHRHTHTQASGGLRTQQPGPCTYASGGTNHGSTLTMTPSGA